MSSESVAQSTRTPSADELLAVAKASPAAVAIHDRAAWVGLYSTDGQVNDPVGSRPHVGREAIERFYDTFIAPNTIVFHVDRDIVCGMTVVRDLTIETIMSTGVKMMVPMHLRYDIVEEAGRLKIQRLYAHWELLPMILQLLGKGPKGIWTSLKLGLQMMRHLGIGGAMGFAQGFAGVGNTGKHRVTAFLTAISQGDADIAKRQLAGGAVMEWPFGKKLPLTQFAQEARGIQWSKLLVAGRTVTATVLLGTSVRGVALFRFGSGEDRISEVQVFVQ
jgi:hypothetical protein